MIQANAVRDATLRVGGLLEDPIIGLTSVRHRICSDNYALPGEKNAFVCRAQSACNAHDVAEGAPIVVEGPVNKRNITPTERAPLITYVTTTRMELAGNFVQMSCRADGTPPPDIEWFVVDAQDEQLLLPMEHLTALWKLTDWDVIADTSKLQDASLTLQCTASNKYGSDSAKLTLILLDGL
ncbi:CRE-ZIG-5 protein [Aphelenchoides avenae]|nr:CRE-ZIG-5 protein [Aphelenchus avenae]